LCGIHLFIIDMKSVIVQDGDMNLVGWTNRQV